MMIDGVIQITILLMALVYLNYIRFNIQKTLLALFIIGLPSMLAMFYLSQMIGIIWLFVSTSVLFYIFTKTKSILLDLCVEIMIGIFANHVSQLLQKTFVNNKSLVTISYLFFFICLFIILTMVYNHLFKQKIKNLSFSLTNQVITIVLASVTIVIFYVNAFVLHDKRLVVLNISIQIVYIAMISLLFFLFVTTTKKQAILEQKQISQQQFHDYMQALAQVNESMQKFHHDYVNILVSMRGYIDEKNIDGLSKYFYTSILPAEQQTLFRNQTLGKLEKINMLEVKSILASKMMQAEQAHIAVNLEIPQPIPTLPIDPIDITRVIGIYLDNAIEASADIENPQINIAFFLAENRIIFIIENKYNIGNVDLDTLFTTAFSTKGNHRGRGLMNARAILTSYKNVTMNTRTQKDWFIQEIQME